MKKLAVIFLLMICCVCPAAVGPNVALNNEFTNWTGDDPDDWEQNTDPDVDQTPEGWCRLIDYVLGEVDVRQDGIITIGLKYRIEITSSINNWPDGVKSYDGNTPFAYVQTINDGGGVYRVVYEGVAADEGIRVYNDAGSGSSAMDKIDVMVLTSSGGPVRAYNRNLLRN